MPQPYLPKIKAQTAKNMAKNLLSTQRGKKISNTKFKQFLKQDKNLRKFTYTSDKSTLAKHQAKNFFSKVAESAKQSGSLKINPLAAKKMGIQINKQGQVSNIGLNKIYQKATTEELATKQESTGPTPAELRRQKRHEKAIETMHKRGRADEIKQEQEQQPKEDEKKTSTPPPRSAGVSGAGTSLSSQTISSTNQGSSTQRGVTKTDTAIPTLLVFPLNNLSTNVKDLAWTVHRINNLVVQTLSSLRVFKIVEEGEINKALTGLNIKKLPTPVDESIIKQIAQETKADLFVTGYIKKVDRILEVKIQMINTATNQRLNLAIIKEEADDIFHLERKIKWQITNVLQGDIKTEDKNLSGIDEAIDLPI